MSGDDWYLTPSSYFQDLDWKDKIPSKVPNDISTILKQSNISITTDLTEIRTTFPNVTNVSKISRKSIKHKNKENKKSSDNSILKVSLKSKEEYLEDCYLNNSMDTITLLSNSNKGRFSPNISKINGEFSQIDKSVCGGATLSSNSNKGQFASNTSIIPENISDLNNGISRSSLSLNSNKEKFTENTSLIPELSDYLNNSMDRTTLSSYYNKERFTPNTSIISELTINKLETNMTETIITKERFTPNMSVISQQQWSTGGRSRYFPVASLSGVFCQPFLGMFAGLNRTKDIVLQKAAPSCPFLG
ncbi:hypothetical protein SNEBB_008666, partial [Seison nebaliae]